MRKKRNYERSVVPDVKYGSKELTKMINNLMYQGNKTTIEKFLYKALEKGSSDLKMEPMAFFNKAVENVTIPFELRSRRVGGATYQVPRPLEGKRSFEKTIKLITLKIKEEKAAALDVKILKVLMDAYNKTGAIYHTLNSLINAAEANKVNAVYRW